MKSDARRRLPLAGILLTLLVASVTLVACGDDDPAPAPVVVTPPAPATAPAPAPPRPAAKVRFTVLDGHGENGTGFAPVNHTGTVADKQWIAEAMGGGMIAIDHDGDGDMDLLTVDGNLLEGDPDPDARSRLFRNDGNFKFTEVTKEAGLDLTGFGNGGAAADYDGDGDTDVYLCFLGRNHLLRNRGDGTFEDVPDAAGAAGPESDMSTACAWGDFDGDGRIDLYVANYIDIHRVMKDFKSVNRIGRSCEWRGCKVYCGPGGLPFQLDRLYLQTAAGTFTDASDRLAKQVARPGFQPVTVDFDEDGDLDIYVANDTTENSLWINDGKGNFRDDGLITGCAVDTNVVPQAGMGVDAADYDGDGLIDLVVTNFSHDHYTLYRNSPIVRKDGTRSLAFEDVSVPAGISLPTYLFLGWGAHFMDVDNDGVLDLFFANGHVYVEIDQFPETQTTYRQRNLLLMGSGGNGAPFRVPEGKSEDIGLDRKGPHRASLAVDLDGDGDEDLVVSQLNEPAYILRNDTTGGGNWLRLSLRRADGGDAAGATVRVVAEGRSASRVALRGNSFLCGTDPRLLFGLGGAGAADRVEVRWPGGKVETWTGLEAGGHWRLVEGQSAAKRLAK